MKQQLEYEVKNLLTNEEFNTLLKALKLNDTEPVEQTNYYFETKTWALRQKKCALRIRERGGHYTLTLKSPRGEGLLETDVALSASEANRLISDQETKNKEVISLLNELAINEHALICGGSLLTYRRQVKSLDVTFFLDESHYMGHVDYELEIEAQNMTIAELQLNALLNKYNIEKRKTPSKIARFYDALTKSSQ